jgi:hypothetical protein
MPNTAGFGPQLFNTGGPTLKEALDLSSQDAVKQARAHASRWQALLAALDGREVDVMVVAKGKVPALAPMGAEIG